MADIVRLWGAINYKADLRFFDNMYKVAKEIGQNFEHWWTDRISVIVHDYERHELIRFSSKQVAFEALNPTDISESFNNLTGTLRRSLSNLNCREVTKMGLKLNIYSNTGLSFDELKQQLRPICVPQNEQLENLTSSEILDFQLKFNYKWNNNTATLRVAPMNKEQGLLDIQNVGEIMRFFPPPHKSDDFSNFCASIPESFLGFDLDVFTQGEHNPNEWPTFASSVVPHLTEVFQGIKNMVLELNNEKS